MLGTCISILLLAQAPESTYDRYALRLVYGPGSTGVVRGIQAEAVGGGTFVPGVELLATADDSVRLQYRASRASFKRLLGRSAPNPTTQLLRLIRPNSQSPTIAQRQLHRPTTCHIVEPAVGGPVNASPIPPGVRYGRARLNLRQGEGTPHHARPEPERKAPFIHLGGEGTKEEGCTEQDHEHDAQNEDGAGSCD